MVARLPASGGSNGSDCIDALRCRTAESGYRGVGRASKNPDGVTVWRAYAKHGGVKYDLGCRSPDPRVCARAVAAWYAHTFGAKWVDALRARKCNPWAVRWSESREAYVAAVWVMGVREEVSVLERLRRPKRASNGKVIARRGDWLPTDHLAIFPTRPAALAGVRRYLRLRYGLCADFVAWRPARG